MNCCSTFSFSFERLEEKRVLSGNPLMAYSTLPVANELVGIVGAADPDQPIITGRLYHQNAMLPFGLPAAKQISGMKTNSVFDNGVNDQLMMDVTTGFGVARIHAQHDMSTIIVHEEPQPAALERDELAAIDEAYTSFPETKLVIGTNETTTVGGMQELTVGILR